MDDSRRRLWLGWLWLGLGALALPGLALALSLFQGESSFFSRAMTGFLLGLPLALIGGGAALVWPATRWNRATEKFTRAILLLLLLLGLLNFVLSVPVLADLAARSRINAIPRLFSWFCNNVLFFWLWREAMSTCGARMQRNCPWRMTVLASLCLVIPTLSAATSIPETVPAVHLTFGGDGAEFYGFPGWINWDYCVGISALVTLLLASRHRPSAVTMTRWLSLCCLWLLVPAWILSEQGTSMRALFPFLPLVFGLSGLFFWLGAELNDRVNG